MLVFRAIVMDSFFGGRSDENVTFKIPTGLSEAC